MTTKKHEVPEEVLPGLLANYKKPEDLIDENGLLNVSPIFDVRPSYTKFRTCPEAKRFLN